MSQQTNVTKGLRPIGGADAKKPGLKVELEGRSFAQATQSEPIPLVWGTVRRAGTYIVPPFGLRAVAVTEKVSK